MDRRRRLTRGFTMVELVIVIAIIAIVSAILIPNLVNVYNDQKNDIIEIYNGSRVVCMCGEDILYEGNKDSIPSDIQENYILINVEYSNGIVYMYFQRKEGNNNEN